MNSQQLVATEVSSLGESNKFISVGSPQGEILKLHNRKELRDREQLELTVGQAFCDTGNALAELRDRRLYHSTHDDFGVYCLDTFGFGRRHADNLIAGAKVVENLRQSSTIHTQILPLKLEQVRPLIGLKTAGLQRLAWDRAVEKAGGVPSGRIVKEIVAQLQPKPQLVVQEACQVDDVFILIGLSGQDRKYNNCWASVTDITDTLITVELLDTKLTVKLENLKQIKSLDEQQRLQQTHKQIRQLSQVIAGDRGAVNVLKNLVKHTAPTDVEKYLLTCLENYYKLDERESQS